MEALAAFADGGDEGDAEASAPVAEEVGEAGGPIVLIGAELGVGDDAQRNEEEGVAEALEGSGEGVVSVVGLQVEAAVVEHRCGYGSDTDDDEGARMDDIALDQLCAD